MVTRHDLRLPDGRLLCAYDSGAGDGEDAFTVIWHQVTPHTGDLLTPLLAATQARGMRLISYARPGYGESTPQPGRNVAAAAGDVAQIADALGLERFAVMGGSGGGPHALACAALLPERVTAAACLASPAPYTTAIDWFAGMAGEGAALRAALMGRTARVEYERTGEFDPESFTARDHATLEGDWAALGEDAQAASTAGPDGPVDDDMAFVMPWGFEVSAISAPVLLVQGGEDRIIPPSHAKLLLAECHDGELWYRPREGHISILAACPLALDWLRAQA